MSRSVSSRLLVVVLFVAVTGLLGGCAQVQAYERGHLAHPTMAAEAFESPAQDHVLAVQEGAMGGTLGAASGCGCN
ncbi:MAG: DUF4266 domain-containing protein [Polyangiaceae bacterium]